MFLFYVVILKIKIKLKFKKKIFFVISGRILGLFGLKMNDKGKKSNQSKKRYNRVECFSSLFVRISLVREMSKS